MSFSVPFWTPKRNWGVGQSPIAAAFEEEKQDINMARKIRR